MKDELKTLIETLENSPREPGRINPDLLGWRTPAGNLLIAHWASGGLLLGWETPAGNLLCAHCAGRIMARGCRLPAGTRPIWKNQDFVGCTPCAVGS